MIYETSITNPKKQLEFYKDLSKQLEQENQELKNSLEQYQKQLRLNEAQRLMLSGEHNAETASYIVGYESPTQFSREYKKMFGNPPKTDVKSLIAV